MLNLIKLAFKNQFFLFLVVGGINTVFGYCIFALFIYIGLHYTLAVLFSTVIGILFNFKTYGSIVFKSHNNKLIFRFFAVYAITYIINVAYLKVFIPYCNVYILGAIAIIPLAIISYFLNKKFVFEGGGKK
ncbi:MAG TPA: polysaccharide biosynthesis protein GtrA [Lentisphaeria bacterium]|nr:MAG: polysaccharide biosynthesis protein GtrA [Lentisphaerae bacterium GWF2_38_69]HBM16427.1 polysaccharide biosynthesis protein GtrA [Lentisphaeria bacterium]